VLAAQGTPTRFSDTLWEYGYSSVRFAGGRVTGWEISAASPLKARMVPASGATNTTFTVGSTKDEVLAAQGTHTRFSDTLWEYGYSSVRFAGGKVTGWEISAASPLRVR